MSDRRWTLHHRWHAEDSEVSGPEYKDGLEVMPVAEHALIANAASDGLRLLIESGELDGTLADVIIKQALFLLDTNQEGRARQRPALGTTHGRGLHAHHQ